ncbi:uncharacterized protein LOC131995716 [Stomoxys calcitrans]|uniref:uncharacterized protein LOC131995716 n=1 Tax=Stomoxys calcitrans TaxID=35570 RepID=UPI0027E335A3|nr:uncharacterized protein LOC131995716 [Stomoxys calcitrans]
MTEPAGQSTSTTGGSVVKPSPIHERFLFDCDHMISFCTSFEKSDITDQTDTLLEIKLEDLECRWKRLQVDYENLMLSPESFNTKDFKQNAKINFNVCSEAYYETRSQITDVLRISGRTGTRSMTRQSLDPRTPVSPQFPDNPDIYIKVPPCDTEVFKGGYEEWPSFRDMFTAVYVNHPKLTPAQKLYHLRNKTRGNAGAIVKRYPLCDENFNLAWTALKTRYENKRVLVDNQLKILFNIPVADVEDSESLQKIHSTVNDCLCTLNSLEVKVDSWDPILIYLISTKLPEVTISQWEQSLRSHRELPTWTQMDTFLVNRFEVVERISSFKSTKERQSLPEHSTSRSSIKIQTYASQESLTPCLLCEECHSIRICPEFRKFSIQERIDFIFRNKYCNNCLSIGHTKNKCKSKSSCLSCRKRHHTLLHLEDRTTMNSGPANGKTLLSSSNTIEKFDTKDATTSSETPKQTQANVTFNNETILLRTALVQIKYNGELFTIRALIDPGSQRSFLSEKIRNLLQIPYRRSFFEVGGIGAAVQKADKECDLVLYSRKHDFHCSVNAIILPKLTNKLPSVSFKKPDSPELRKLDLADPNFNKGSNIDLILGNDSERHINLDGIVRNICGVASAYNTIFGWVLSGPVPTETSHSFTTNVVPSEGAVLSDLLRKFWEIEEIPSTPQIPESHRYCEELYATTTTRDSDGRYVVRLPFKRDFPQNVYLGPSRFLALGQYARLEKSLSRDSELHDEYISVLNEYITLGHMEEISPQEICSQGKFYSFYLPHHAVVRPEHKSTKVRVVFNASRKTNSGCSLNDVLYTGPTLQADLVSTILNWRKFKYVYNGDIQKMYRQIKVHPEDRPYQRILFQRDSKSPIKDYQLSTVTFGINCAPFLAIRTLLQLASDTEEEFPQISKILRKETYVDDILSGGFTIEETLDSQAKLMAVLNTAGFPLKKITANDTRLLAHIRKEDLYDLNFLSLSETSSTKTLGMKWNALSDQFSYTAIPMQEQAKVTKRQVLSKVAQLFDPAGWITPIIIRAKILMQQLWLEDISWDEEISSESLYIWRNLLNDISHIEQIAIPRWIKHMPTDKVELHGFCDASKAAYCACVYVRSQTTTSSVFCNLLAAKSKVAPIKTISLPKLELNGALLLAKLIKYTTSVLDFDISTIILWTDASIVLGWLSKPPMTWETYVANRTSQILDLVPNAKFRYVPTHDNPADLGTRGCKPQDLQCNPLWWNGPPWLTRPESGWPKKISLTVPKPRIVSEVFHAETKVNDVLQRFSSYTRALRVLSYVYRFYYNSRSQFRTSHRFEGINLNQKELQFIKTRLILLSQQRYYEDEYKALLDSKPIPKNSSLSTFNPFLDCDQILRINGRLSNSMLPYKERYPIIIPEGVLNSRPISPLSEDPSELKALTPGHFLKGSPIMSLPEPLSPSISVINRWIKLKALHHQFAQRWKEDYLKALHKRYKWKYTAPDLKVDDFVIVIDDLLPPSEWRMGRIEKTYPGTDGKIRIVDVRTSTGVINRPIAKLCYLPSPSMNGRRQPNIYKCKLCDRFHALKVCPRFLDMTPRQRNIVVLKEMYCVNCLARSHRFRDCRSANMCQRCQRPHHTLLHSMYPEIMSRQSEQNVNQTNSRTANRPTKTQTKWVKNQRSNHTPGSNQQILSEAIRALASVLCSSSGPAACLK